MPPELVVVVPVYNEEAAIGAVLDEWMGEVSAHCGSFLFLVVDDGSTDGTPGILSEMERKHGSILQRVRHENRGHGQSCLAGYRMGISLRAEYIFQIDSDGQCDPAYFSQLWALREGFDVIYGERVRRDDGWKRVCASMLLKWTLLAATGALCADANSPYRLFRTQRLEPFLHRIPSDFHLANVALSVLLRKASPEWRHATVPIRFRKRMGGNPSVPISSFASRACQLILQLRTMVNA